MKRYSISILIVLLLFSFCGCKQKGTDFVEPVTFYYCNDIVSNEISSNDFYNVFVGETHEGAGYINNLQALLALYLQGPADEALITPFPDDLQILSIHEENLHIALIVSNDFASLTGLDLTIACTCLSMTVMELTGCNSVLISAESTLLDENDSITMTRDILVFSDNTYVVSED